MDLCHTIVPATVKMFCNIKQLYHKGGQQMLQTYFNNVRKFFSALCLRGGIIRMVRIDLEGWWYSDIPYS